jgi:DHA1 family multidrug resistance protein-like MFS transporter
MAGVLLMTTGIGLVAFATTLPAVFLLLACFYLGIVIAEPARETLMTKLAQPGARGSYMGFSRLGLALGGMTGYVGGGALHDYAMAQGQPWLPWLVLGTVGVTTLLLLANCFQRGSRLAGVNA